jgi:PPK2 family polyphosphate:nucleotide phosphotransferase
VLHSRLFHPHRLYYTAQMKEKKLVKQTSRLAAQYCVAKGEKFRLKDFDPADASGVKSKDQAQELLQHGLSVLPDMQERLYAQDRWGLLIVLQGMDAAGKDGVIKHVMTGVNPQSCDVHAFKTPSNEELNHDFLWRCNKVLPERGKIGIFNRSYYEEVLVTRVHPELLNAEKLPDELITKHIWEKRLDDINDYERYLMGNGIAICKFFLHISKEEQKKRFLERVDDPRKNWKFSMNDLKERAFWKDYQRAYEEMIQQTATKHAPWYVVPADNKWLARVVVAAAVIEKLSELKVDFPKVDKAQRKELENVRRALLKDEA